MKKLQNILFIINPISGTGKQKHILQLLKDNLDTTKYQYQTVFSEYEGHATELAKQAIGKYNIVVAVGGDGTINEVAQALTNTNVVMGIIAIGSGNGLARHLKLPLKPINAIKLLNKANIKTIDTATINDKVFVNVAGIGFDAHVAHLYANSPKRGAIPYVKFTASEFTKYQPIDYNITIDDNTFTESAFLISFANSSQFGNNAYISPKAIIDDGLLDICILKKFPAIHSGVLAIQLFDKNIDKSRYMKIVRGKNIVIKTQDNIKAHIDGEPISFNNELRIQINPLSLQIIC